jgi:hypothetical protein
MQRASSSATQSPPNHANQLTHAEPTIHFFSPRLACHSLPLVRPGEKTGAVAVPLNSPLMIIKVLRVRRSASQKKKLHKRIKIGVTERPIVLYPPATPGTGLILSRILPGSGTAPSIVLMQDP